MIWRWFMVMGVVFTGATIEQIWPGFPSMGVVGAACYWIGRWRDDEDYDS